jgi:hypothetical protein
LLQNWSDHQTSSNFGSLVGFQDTFMSHFDPCFDMITFIYGDLV